MHVEYLEEIFAERESRSGVVRETGSEEGLLHGFGPPFQALKTSYKETVVMAARHATVLNFTELHTRTG